jgi:hypothetical protein
MIGEIGFHGKGERSLILCITDDANKLDLGIGILGIGLGAGVGVDKNSVAVGIIVDDDATLEDNGNLRGLNGEAGPEKGDETSENGKIGLSTSLKLGKNSKLFVSIKGTG